MSNKKIFSDYLRNILIKQLHQGNYHNLRFGVSCVFIKLTDTIGAKIYLNKKSRDYAYKSQKFLNKKGIAPIAHTDFCIPTLHMYSEFECLELKWKRNYGFLTEIAEVIPDGEDKFHKKDMAELCKKIEKLGFSTKDLHFNNVGYLKNMLVCIDTDKYTMTAKY